MRKLDLFNKALLLKWNWHFSVGKDALWKSIIVKNMVWWVVSRLQKVT